MDTPAAKRILIADDHPMVRGALALAILAVFGRIDIEEFDDFGELASRLEQLGSADMVLLDLRMPGVKGFESLIALRSQFPETPAVVISALATVELVNEALALGAVGFIPKSKPRAEIVAALRAIAAGEIYVPDDLKPTPNKADSHAADALLAQRVATLTRAQRKVLQMLGTGKLNKEIAYELDIVETTVKAHVSAILQKLHVYSRTKAVVLASRLHLNDFDDIAEP